MLICFLCGIDLKINVEFGNLWVIDLQENSKFEIDDNISGFMYTYDRGETKKICLGRTGEYC